jgi:hypothetical protein
MQADVLSVWPSAEQVTYLKGQGLYAAFYPCVTYLCISCHKRLLPSMWLLLWQTCAGHVACSQFICPMSILRKDRLYSESA